MALRTDKTSANSVVCVHSILGVTAGYARNYQFSVEGATKGQNCEIRAYASVASNFTIQTIYFDSAVPTLAYGYQQFALQTAAAPQARTLWLEFAPVVDYLAGLASFSLSASTLSLALSFDSSSNLLTVAASASVPSFTVGVFAVGQPTASVCAPCGNFVTVSGCLDACSPGSFAYTFASGGKTCRQCSSQLGQTASAGGCVCPTGSQYYQGNCYPLGSQPTICPAGQLLFGTLCLGPSSLNCSAHASPTNDGLSCVCDKGY